MGRVQPCSEFLMLADSGVERITSGMISKVALARDEDPDFFNAVMASVGELARRIIYDPARDLSETKLFITR
ncbi:MAG: hypothetical protein ACUVUS_07220 [Thermoproteota archaeon]